MRSDWDTFQDARQSVLSDLQRVSRRANGIAPVVNPEDIGIIRNIIRPALDMGKFGEAGLAFIRSSPYVSPTAFLKHAGFLGDWWSDIKSGVSDIGSGLYDVGAGALKTVASPYYAYKGYQQGGLGGAVEGAFSGLGQLGGGVAGIGEGVLSAIPYARRAEIDLPLIGRKSIAGLGGEIMPWLIPGAGTTRAATLGGRALNVGTTLARAGAGPTRAATLGGRALNVGGTLARAGSVASGAQEGLEMYRQARAAREAGEQDLAPHAARALGIDLETARPDMDAAVRSAWGIDVPALRDRLQQMTGSGAPAPAIGPFGGWMGAGRSFQ